MIPIARPFIGEEEKKAVIDVMDSRMLAQGPRVKEFEERFADWVGTRNAVAVSSGTAALHLSLLAMDIGPGDEVITTPLTFFASASTIMMVGAKPVFVDVERESYNIDPERVAEAITPATKAIVPVHLYGLAADMGPIMDIAEEKGIKVLEDACQAHGAECDREKVGSIGHAGCFSFYPTKNMMSGEGGMVVTDDDRMAERLRLLRNHGSPKRYTHSILGYNLRMTDISAAIGLCQMDRIEGFNQARQKNAEMLTETVTAIQGLTPPSIPANRKHVFHQYALMVENDFPLNRQDAFDFVRENGVGADVGYHIPLHRQPIFESYEYGGGECPVADEIAARELLLPVHPAVNEEDLEHISNVLRSTSER